MIDNAVRVYPDGREVCCDSSRGIAEYKRRTFIMYQRQDRICGACNTRMNSDDVTFDHDRPRGYGGAFRDDRIVDADGKWMNRAVHLWCNSTRGSRRL